MNTTLQAEWNVSNAMPLENLATDLRTRHVYGDSTHYSLAYLIFEKVFFLRAAP